MCDQKSYKSRKEKIKYDLNLKYRTFNCLHGKPKRHVSFIDGNHFNDGLVPLALVFSSLMHIATNISIHIVN